MNGVTMVAREAPGARDEALLGRGLHYLRDTRGGRHVVDLDYVHRCIVRGYNVEPLDHAACEHVRVVDGMVVLVGASCSRVGEDCVPPHYRHWPRVVEHRVVSLVNVAPDAAGRAGDVTGSGPLPARRARTSRGLGRGGAPATAGSSLRRSGPASVRCVGAARRLWGSPFRVLLVVGCATLAGVVLGVTLGRRGVAR